MHLRVVLEYWLNMLGAALETDLRRVSSECSTSADLIININIKTDGELACQVLGVHTR